MPLPQQVVEQLAREPVQAPGWSAQLLMFSITIFFISLAVYFGLLFGYKPYLNSQVNELDKQIQQFSQQIPQADQGKIITFYSQLANLKTVLGKHPIASPLFDWLEKNTEANVYYTRFGLNAGINQLNLNGVVKTPADLAQQLLIFQNLPEVDRINFNNLNIAAGSTWQFDITLFLKPEFFSQQPISQ